MKRPAAATKEKAKATIEEAKGGSKPPMPKGSVKAPPPTFQYNGGTIYTAYSKNNYRVIQTRGIYATEKRVSWGQPNPTKDHWRAALKVIDDARARGM